MSSSRRQKFWYYFSIFFGIVISLLIFIHFYAAATASNNPSLIQQILYYAKFFWFSGALVAVTNIIGLLYFGCPDHLDNQNINRLATEGWNKQKLLIVAYVSRGNNYEALGRAMRQTIGLLLQYQISFRVDVVTDIEVADRLTDLAATFHLVPDDYSTTKRAKYKARALHFLVEEHAKKLPKYNRENIWIIHLDEESSLTASSIAGIHSYINNEQNKNTIGQGEIQYNSYNYADSWLITAMDSIRTGDDLGRFRFQFSFFHKPLFGMHGSYILVPHLLERQIGFDLGGRGSITEDAYFALISASQGVQFNWVDGHITEQSPFTLKEIIRQRRRWYCGLMLLAFDGLIPLRNRFWLLINMLLWTVAWVGPIITMMALLFGGYFPLSALIMAGLLQGFYSSVYLVGAYRNLFDLKISIFKKAAVYLAVIILMPISNIIEGLAVLYGLLAPVRVFDVVNK